MHATFLPHPTAVVEVVDDKQRQDEGDSERRVADALAATVADAESAMERLALQDAILAVESFVGVVNGYVTEQEPWKVAKDDGEDARRRLGTILYTAAESLRAIAVLHNPVLPKACAHLWSALGAAEQLGALADQPVGDAGRWGQLREGAQLTKGAALFPRLSEDTVA